MIVHTVTGGTRDYIQLEPETLREFSYLLRVHFSKFLPLDATYCDVGNIDHPHLRIHLTTANPRMLSDDMRNAIDETP